MKRKFYFDCILIWLAYTSSEIPRCGDSRILSFCNNSIVYFCASTSIGRVMHNSALASSRDSDTYGSELC